MAIRFELSGTMAPSSEPPIPVPSNPPRGVLTYHVDTVDKTLAVKVLMDAGYTAFDVITIGGGGGTGGPMDGVAPPNNGAAPPTGNSLLKLFGGAGGGGGIQRVRGLLADLPDTVTITVGDGGNRGTPGSNAATSTDGQDGGASTFNGTTCQASGGKGGHKATGPLYMPNGGLAPSPTHGDGGDGGLGGTTVAGGGGHGALAGVPNTNPPAAIPGAWDPVTGIGGGGGGGGGGQGIEVANDTPKADGTGAIFGTTSAASPGAGGAFNANDNSVYAPGGLATIDPNNLALAESSYGGFGGGATAGPINGLSASYGDSAVGFGKGDPGVVVIAVSAK